MCKPISGDMGALVVQKREYGQFCFLDRGTDVDYSPHYFL
jgi:hypothetical protein